MGALFVVAAMSYFAGARLGPIFHFAGDTSSANIREFDSRYHFISPLLACSTDENLAEGQAKALERQLMNAIKVHEDAGDLSTVSIYFRDFEGGPWVGINLDQTFNPGSLLKLPLAMSLYKEAEVDPTILQKNIPYTGTETSDVQFYAPPPLAAGKYTVAALIERMLIYSDNNATSELTSVVSPDVFNGTYENLGLTQPTTANPNYSLSTKDYETFFRVLYNATYLSDYDSEHILETLSHSSFKDGLVAGVPNTVVVSHKFGERSLTSSSSLVQLHDCGIVYAPNHPYLLCVMAQGPAFPALAKDIAEFSNITYNYVE